jgi:hypothetical protein
LWKKNAVRRTNFSIESIETVCEVTESKTLVTLHRTGDLVKSCMLELTMMKSSEPSSYPAEQFVKNIRVLIGNKRTDTIDSFPIWNRIRDNLSDPDRRAANRRMMNFGEDDPPGSIRTLYLELPLFFSLHSSVALPLIALHNNDVQLEITFQDPGRISGIDPSYPPEVRFYADYVFLDRVERAYFARAPHEYLIEQVQTHVTAPVILPTLNTVEIALPFELPTRYLAWVFATDVHGVYTTSKTETSDVFAPLHSAVVRCDGADRFSSRPGEYFTLVQPVQGTGRALPAGMYMYCFGTNVCEENSAGTLNFSHATVTLELTTKAATALRVADATTPDTTLVDASTTFTQIVIFAKSFNVLRILEGKCTVLFPLDRR